MNLLTSLIKNSFFSILVNFINRVGNIVVFILIINIASIESGGEYNLGVSYFFIGSRFAFWGLDQLLTKQGAKSPQDLPNIFPSFLATRIALGILTTLVFTIALLFTNHTGDEKTLIIYFLIAIIPEAINNLCNSVFAAMESMHLAGFAAIASIFIRALLITLLLILELPIKYVGLIFLIAQVFSVAININLTYSSFQFNLKFIDRAFIYSSLQSALPFFFISVLNGLEARLDQILISMFHDNADLGRYSSALIYISAVAMFGEGYRVSLFPLLSKTLNKKERVKSLLLGSYKVLAVMGLLSTIVLVSYADTFILIINRNASILESQVLKVLAFGITFSLLSIINNRILVTINRQDLIAGMLFGRGILSLLANLFLIQYYGIIGAAFVKILTAVFMFGVTWLQTRSNFPEIYRANNLIKFLLVFIGVAVPLIIFDAQGNFFQFSISVTAFAACSIGFKFITVEEILIAIRLIRSWIRIQLKTQT